MRALAHPARLAILDHLSLSEAGATATECAEVVGLSPSATSYHLRALAQNGLIEEAPSRGDARERVWRSRYRQYSIGADSDASPEELAAEAAVGEAFLARQNEKVRRFLAVAKEYEDEWYHAATMVEKTLTVTAAELTELVAGIEELVRPFTRLHRQDAPPAALNVSLQLRAVPLDPPRS